MLVSDVIIRSSSLESWGDRVKHLLHLFFKEFKKALPPTLFFMAAFHISTLLRHLDEESLGVTTDRAVSATIAALVVGKVFLVLDNLGLNKFLLDRPMIYAMCLRTMVYSCFVSLAWCLEDFVPLLLHHLTWQEAWQDYRQDFSKPMFWANHLVLMLWVMAYAFSSMLIEIIGKERVLAVFLGVKLHGKRIG